MLLNVFRLHGQRLKVNHSLVNGLVMRTRTHVQVVHSHLLRSFGAVRILDKAKLCDEQIPAILQTGNSPSH
jgi:hypothetical protein